MDVTWETETICKDDPLRAAAFDPSIWWLLGGGSADFLPPASPPPAAEDEPTEAGVDQVGERWLTALITLKDEAGVQRFSRLVSEGKVVVPSFVDRGTPGRPFAAVLPQTVILQHRDLWRTIKLSQPTRAWIAAPGLPEPDDPAVTKAPPRSVITAVIDDGFAVAHERFRDAEGRKSRVHHLWMMGAERPSSGATVALGREWCKPEIDDLLALSEGVDGRIDEARFLREAGMVDAGSRLERLGPAMRRLSHGMHVMDLAAGHEPADERSDRPIIAVQLPSDSVEDTSGATLDAVLAMALDYIRARALAIAEKSEVGPIPVVVNLSYGFTAGSHDGASKIEALMDQLVAGTNPRMQIVLSAGNAHLDRGHARVPAPGAPWPPDGAWHTELHWRVQPDDRTPSLLQMWLPAAADGGPDRVRVEVKAPVGGWSPALGEDPFGPLVLVREDAPGRPRVASLRYGVDPASGRGLFELRALPTGRAPDAAEPLSVAPAGAWRVRVSVPRPDVITREAPLMAWVQRSDTIPGYPMRGRQAHFEDQDHPDPTPAEYALAPVLALPDRLRSDGSKRNGKVDPAVEVRRENMLNAIATGTAPLVAGAYERKRRFAAPFSAGGESGAGGPPTLLVDAADGMAALGTLAAGARSGSWVAMGGTSVAAPRLTRLAVELFARGGTPTRGAVAVMGLVSDDATLARGRDDLPEDRGGAGRLRLGRGRDAEPPALGEGVPVDRGVAEEP